MRHVAAITHPCTLWVQPIDHRLQSSQGRRIGGPDQVQGNRQPLAAQRVNRLDDMPLMLVDVDDRYVRYAIWSFGCVLLDWELCAWFAKKRGVDAVGNDFRHGSICAGDARDLALGIGSEKDQTIGAAK